MKCRCLHRYLIVLLAIICAIPALMGQREKNNIYLFDCTGSMKTNGLWEPARAALDATIMTQSTIPGSQFCIIPFGDNPYEHIHFGSDQYGGRKKAIEEAFGQYVTQAKYTHISDVLTAGFGKADPRKENKIYLLTDGLPNGGDSAEKVARAITAWCSSHRNSRLFYVALTNGVINPLIRDAIDACPDAFIVQCEGKVIPQIADIAPSEVYTNLEELGAPMEIAFSIPGRHPLRVEASDSLFNVKVQGDVAAGGGIRLSLSPRDGLDTGRIHQLLQGGEYTFPVTLQCSDPRYFIANPQLTVHVTDEIPAAVELGAGEPEISAPDVRWYDSFLWSNAAPEQKARWDLAPIFKNQLADTRLRLRFQSAVAEDKDFRAWYNDVPISNGTTIDILPGRPAVLEVVFDHDAAPGKRYFSLTTASAESLDMINCQPADEYQGTSLRTGYLTGWNPLKTLLFWLGVVILIALVLWLTVLKRIVFPTIKMSKAEFTGPGTYYLNKKIKGARKVVLTSRRHSQNPLARLFTGEIRYVRADHFSPEITILPAGGKKKVKLRQEDSSRGRWEIYPSAIFGQFEKGTISKPAGGEKFNIEFS